MAEHLELELDPSTAAWLRRRCIDRSIPSLSAAALDALQVLALRDAVAALASSPATTAAYAESSAEETERALAAS